MESAVAVVTGKFTDVSAYRPPTVIIKKSYPWDFEAPQQADRVHVRSMYAVNRC